MDDQNAAVPGAEVKLTETSTNTSQTTVTNDAGRFAFPSVQPGTYNVTFASLDFPRTM